MAEEAPTHRQIAVEAFNRTWRLLDKARRTPDEDLEMIHLAHASRYHWGIAGGPITWARGEWQISRVYSVLGRGEPALYHAERCLEYVDENDLGEFDKAAAHEAMVRAFRANGDIPAAKESYERAWDAAKRIVEPEDRAVIFADLHEHAEALGLDFPDPNGL